MQVCVAYFVLDKKEIVMCIIVVEIPHQLPAKAWIADTLEDIMYNAEMNHSFVYNTWTAEEARKVWDEDNMPKRLKALLDTHKEVIETGYSEQSDFYIKEEAESHIDAAKEAIGHDLHSCHFLTIDEAHDFINTYCGHQSSKASAEVRKALKLIP